MRKILASLFVIAALLGVGVFATGAYFTDTVTQNNLTFTTGNADLKLGFCQPGVGGDCADDQATLDSFDFGPLPDALTGPGKTGADCLVYENKGVYALNLTGGIFSYSQSDPGMDDAFLVKAEMANSSCLATGSVIFSSQSLWSASNAGFQSFGSLTPGGRIYVIWSNSWESTGNQNTLQDDWIVINTHMTGKTE